MIRLQVWVTGWDGTSVHAGNLITQGPAANGALRGQFRYTEEYLAKQGSFALDPEHLPLTNTIFEAERLQAGIHSIFEDSLPDDWGRRLLVRHHKLSRDRQRVPHLLQLLGGDGLGALSYSNPEEYPVRRPFTSGHDMTRLMKLAEDFEKESPLIDEELALLFEAGSSPGGARPKVVVTHEGRFWIAKLPSIRDRFDMVAIEAATMALAGQAGLDVAHTEVQVCGSKKILLVERFDLAPTEGGRYHMASMQTLLGAEGYYHLGYRDMADIIRRVSVEPIIDLQKLFRQMVFNFLIGNTDDHLKNFCMLHKQEGWRLSPAFDILPNTGMNQEHQLHIANDYRRPTHTALLHEARHFGIKKHDRAQKIFDKVHATVSSWQQLFDSFEVPEKDIEILGRDIIKRLT